MMYFSNPRTEEELKEQFRKLLIKNNYRDPKNQKLIAEIRKEYDSKLLEIKRANGYQTLGDKAKSFIDKAATKAKEYADEAEREKQLEQQRIACLKSKKYTKQEYYDLINREKKYIDHIVKSVVQNQEILYKSLKANIKENSYETLYRFFVSNTMLLQHVIDKKSFDALREEIEYATDYLSQNRKHYEQLMLQVEKMLGEHIAKALLAYEEMYVDPIKIQESDALYKPNGKMPVSMNQIIRKGLTLPAYIIMVVMILYGFVEESAWGIAFLCVVWILFFEGYYFLIVRPLEKRKNRVRTHKDATEKESLLKGLAHLISSLLR